ncbi:MAG TPA: methyltransferase [Vicinamibacteria bacterium]|nr:methyltransferase [Vicinamibacteria bacterium]
MAYLLDKDKQEAQRRLSLLARIQDPATIAFLERVNVRPGWRCLEVGAGSGTIASWLRERTTPGGRVVATDIDTTFVEPLRSETFEVRRHDLVTDELESDSFDLVHARNVLIHIPERELVLQKLAGAVKPGGVLVIEEADRMTDGPDPTAPDEMKTLYEKVVGEIYAFVEHAGLDPSFGGKLFGLVQRLGFHDVVAEGRAYFFRGNPHEDGSAHVPAFVELKEPIIARGNVTPAEFDGFVALTRNPAFAWREGLIVACRGQKPKRAQS